MLDSCFLLLLGQKTFRFQRKKRVQKKALKRMAKKKGLLHPFCRRQKGTHAGGANRQVSYYEEYFLIFHQR
jgi:hypothetical protein